MLLAGFHCDGKSIPRRWKWAGCEGGETAGWVEGSIEVDSRPSGRVGFVDDEEPTAAIGRDARGLVGEHHEKALATGVGQQRMLNTVKLESKRSRDLMRLDELRRQGHVDGRSVLGWFERRIDSSCRIKRVSLDTNKILERLGGPITDTEY